MHEIANLHDDIKGEGPPATSTAHNEECHPQAKSYLLSTAHNEECHPQAKSYLLSTAHNEECHPQAKSYLLSTALYKKLPLWFIYLALKYIYGFNIHPYSKTKMENDYIRQFHNIYV